MTEGDAALRDCGVIYFGNDWQAENRTSSHHVAARLARHLPVLYVDSPGLRAPSASGRDFKRALRKLGAALRRPREVAPGLWHCTVPQLPFRRVPGVEALNRWFGRWAVRRARRALPARRLISWFVVPHPGFLAGRLGEALCVYYCIDDYAAHPGVDAELIGRRVAPGGKHFEDGQPTPPCHGPVVTTAASTAGSNSATKCDGRSVVACGDGGRSC